MKIFVKTFWLFKFLRYIKNGYFLKIKFHNHIKDMRVHKQIRSTFNSLIKP